MIFVRRGTIGCISTLPRGPPGNIFYMGPHHWLRPGIFATLVDHPPFLNKMLEDDSKNYHMWSYRQ
eukprot:5893593-Pyramimonas_sp.AAC.1